MIGRRELRADEGRHAPQYWGLAIASDWAKLTILLEPSARHLVCEGFSPPLFTPLLPQGNAVSLPTRPGLGPKRRSYGVKVKIARDLL